MSQIIKKCVNCTNRTEKLIYTKPLCDLCIDKLKQELQKINQNPVSLNNYSIEIDIQDMKFKIEKILEEMKLGSIVLTAYNDDDEIVKITDIDSY